MQPAKKITVKYLSQVHDNMAGKNFERSIVVSIHVTATHLTALPIPRRDLRRKHFVRYAESKTLKVPSHKKILFLQGVLALRFWADATKSHGRQWFPRSKKINIFLKYVTSSYSVFSLFNFLVFLRQGHFQSLLHRIAGTFSFIL